MRDILLLETIYGPFWYDLITFFRSKIKNLFEDLELNIESIILTERGNIYVRFSGSDEEFAYNLLKKEYHICQEIENFKSDSVYYGKFIDINKYGYGFYVNIGAYMGDTFSDALIPLYKLREQLVNNSKVSSRKIIYSFGLINQMPVEVQIKKIDFSSAKIDAEFSKKQLKKFNKWIDAGNDRVNLGGVLKRKIKESLKKTGHEDDIIKIEKLGLFEYSMVCKEGTSAPGIIAHIGPKLRGIEMNAFIPSKIINFKK
ncbi:MAG: DUF2110 family protein [Candidatus Helarchaeota archaeon]